jgi:hypothetical protein
VGCGPLLALVLCAALFSVFLLVDTQNTNKNREHRSLLLGYAGLTTHTPSSSVVTYIHVLHRLVKKLVRNRRILTLLEVIE